MCDDIHIDNPLNVFRSAFEQRHFRHQTGIVNEYIDGTHVTIDKLLDSNYLIVIAHVDLFARTKMKIRK